MSSQYWTPTVAALDSFFKDQLSQGINVALNMFPAEAAGSNECVTSLYNPVQYPLCELDLLTSCGQDLTDAMTLAGTTGTTPMYGALDGTYQVAMGHAIANPDRKTVVVFTSDGDPCCGDCSSYYGGSQYEEIPAIASLASAAFNGPVQVETYCIIIDTNAQQALDAIAMAGSGNQTAAFNVAGNISQFAQKMEEIRKAALGCVYVIPEPEQEEFDKTKVNVKYTPGGTTEPIAIPQADNEQDCGSDHGWYYDDNLDPTTITLCPYTCAAVEADAEAKIDILFGCPTESN